MTRPGWLTTTAGAAAVGAVALAAAAQTVAPLALSEWFRPQPPLPAAAREAARERLAAVRDARRTQVALHPAGHWQSRRRGHAPRRWRAQLARDTETGAITGRIFVAGSGVLADGTVTGAIDGTAVSGIVADEHGTRVATFTGSVFTGGMSGTYETTSGDTGTWSVPDAVLAGR